MAHEHLDGVFALLPLLLRLLLLLSLLAFELIHIKVFLLDHPHLKQFLAWLLNNFYLFIFGGPVLATAADSRLGLDRAC